MTQRSSSADERQRERAIDAESRAGKWIADGNEALERGQKAKAERCFDKAQHWLDKANELRGLS